MPLRQPTYLLGSEVLNVEVSCFKNYDTPANPKPVNMLTWLAPTGPRSMVHQARVIELRSIKDKKTRDIEKAKLPAITPSGLFSYRSQNNLIRHSGLIQFDIDLQDNPRIRNYTDLKRQLCKLPIVAYCSLSLSGNGYWGLVAIACPERHGQHFDALKRVFARYRITLDGKPRNVASLRGYSYDPNAYFAERVELFDIYDAPPTPKLRSIDFTSDASLERARFEACLNEFDQLGLYIEHYEDWYSIACSLANTFGEEGRDYFHIVSQYHPTKYNLNDTDKQYTKCLKANSKFTLGTFFRFCQQHAIEWKSLMPTRRK